MIKKIEIENFKSYLKTSLELGPFNVLVGPNDSGKTNFLSALRLLKYIAQGRISEFFEALPYYFVHCQIPGCNQYIKMSIDIELETESLIYSIVIDESPSNGIFIAEESLFDSKNRDMFYLKREKDVILALNEEIREEETKTFESNQTALPLLTDMKTNKHAWLVTQKLKNILFYNFDTRRMSEPRSKMSERNLILSEMGTNLSNVLFTLSNEHKENFERLKSLLKKEISYVSDLEIRESEQYLYVLVSFDTRYKLFGEMVSDGLIKLLGILALVCSPASAFQISIEEIENHVHHHRLECAIDHLRSLTLRPDPSQVILTTHSPSVLNLTKPKEILIVERSPAKGSNITPLMKKQDIAPFLKEMPIGDIWLSRIIGGVP